METVTARSNGKFWIIGGVAAGVLVAAIAAVVILVGVMNRGVDVPNVVGLGVVEAEQTLADRELVNVTTEEEFSDDVPAGVIIDQSPRSATTVSPETSVILTVSKGPELEDVISTFDFSDLDAYNDSSSDCETWVRAFAGLYSDAVLQDSEGETVGSMEAGGWTEDSSNGTYYPCKATTVFSDVPTNRDEYRIVLNPDDSDPDRSPAYSRSTMESNDWTIEW